MRIVSRCPSLHANIARCPPAARKEWDINYLRGEIEKLNIDPEDYIVSKTINNGLIFVKVGPDLYRWDYETIIVIEKIKAFSFDNRTPLSRFLDECVA